MKLLALMRKDARVLVRNRALLAALLLYPLALAGVLGAAYQEPPQVIHVALVDQTPAGAGADVGGVRIGIADLLAAAGPAASVRDVGVEEDALALLRAGSVDAVIVVPRDFFTQLTRLGDSTTLRLVVDESDPVRATLARQAVEGAVGAFVESVVQKKIADVVDLLRITVEGGTRRVVIVDVRVLGIDGSLAKLEEVRATLDPGSPESAKLDEVIDFLGFARGFLADSERYLSATAVPVRVQNEGLAGERPSVASVALPGALVLGVLWTGGLAAAILAARDRETGAFRRIAAAPGARAVAVASRTLVALVAALVPAAFVLIIGILSLGATVAAPVLTLLALALAALAAAALGAFAAALARGTGGAALVVVLTLTPLLLLGGLFYPVAYMPPAAQAIARVLPVTLATDALRGAMLRGSSLVELAPALGGLLATALLLAGGAWFVSRRTA